MFCLNWLRTKTYRKRSRYEQIEDIDENDGKTHNPFFIIFGKKLTLHFMIKLLIQVDVMA